MLNLDFNKRVVISTDHIEWQPSGLPGIDLKPLAIEDSETGHLTALVRYSNGSVFTRKERSNGEEMLILAGNFSGQHADFRTGTYYRSPPNNEQMPLGQNGCVMLLKLNQFDPLDKEKVAINTQEMLWNQLNSKIKVQLLHQSRISQTMIMHWNEGTQISLPEQTSGGAEVFVLKGCIKDERGEEYSAGTWLRTPGKIFEGAVATRDSAAFIKYGHIRLN